MFLMDCGKISGKNYLWRTRTTAFPVPLRTISKRKRLLLDLIGHYYTVLQGLQQQLSYSLFWAGYLILSEINKNRNQKNNMLQKIISEKKQEIGQSMKIRQVILKYRILALILTGFQIGYLQKKPLKIHYQKQNPVLKIMKITHRKILSIIEMFLKTYWLRREMQKTLEKTLFLKKAKLILL
ncbi:hypothetical protein FGO68_gene13138 [Halteria grandinella]|uniref:Uncharacterized protein n=1 Tax=Halteria grandinella TaxID=5974 RepID=A0A8J8NB07_HALGN|nr:hypothetical protein FGO68_gene13138 [Halteria grandinella]